MATATKEKPVKFTQDDLSKLVGTLGRRAVVHDPKTPGLRAELREGGSVTFYVYRWLPGGGSPVRVNVGKFPDVTIDRARTLAAKHLADIAEGKNPAATKRAKKGESTLAELFTHWLNSHAKPHKKTWPQDERQYETYLKPFHNRKLSTISKPDVQTLHARLGTKNGKYQANRVLALLRTLFNAADDLGFTGANPCRGVKPFKEESRDRFLQPAELPKFFAALKAEPNETVRDYFLLALFTGARRGNVRAMRWADIDLDQCQWRIVGKEAKAGKVLFIPLGPPAMAILRRRREAADKDAEFVLPSYGKRGHIAETKAGWQRILKAAEIKDLRPHDLRRTLGSYMAIQGASLNIIGATLGHSQPSTTAIYARLTSNAVAESVTRTTAFLEAAATPVEPGKPKRKRGAK